MTRETGRPAGRDAQLALAIAEENGLAPIGVEPIVDRGSVNHVFLVRTSGRSYVVRFARDPRRQDSYAVEAWCLARAAAVGIPSPVLVARGVLGQVPYLVQTFVDGAPGPTGGLAEWRTLGRYARLIHAIPVTEDAPAGLFSRFGRDLPAAWRAHLDYNLDQLGPSDELIGLGVYSPDELPRLREVLLRLRSLRPGFGLTHGDLTLRNLLLPEGGAPVLLDWDTAAAGPTPYGDLLSLVRMQQEENDPDAAALAAFADGYSLRLPELLPTLHDQLVLGQLDLVRWAREQRPDLVADTVAAARVGIQRNLD